MKIKLALVVLFLFLISVTEAQEKKWALKTGMGISNGYAPNGQVSVATFGGYTEDVSFFDYKTSYQIGLTKYFRETYDGSSLFINAQFGNYGFGIDDIIINLNYIEADLNLSKRYGNNGQFTSSIGLGPSYLIGDTILTTSNKWDLRANAIFGMRLIDNLKVFLQAKLGVLNLDKESQIKSFMLSLNTEFSIF